MKTTLLIAALSAALGAAAGRWVPVREPEAVPTDAASAPEPATQAFPEAEPVDSVASEHPRPANAAEEMKALDAEIAALRKDPRTWTAEQIQHRKDELLKQFETLLPGHDPLEVVDIAQQLARLGPAGWPEALKALTSERDYFKWRDADKLDAFLDACDGPLLDVMQWALTEPTLKDSDEARTLAALALTRHFDQDDRIAPLLLKVLSTEASADVAELLAGAIPRMFPGPVIPDLGPSMPVNHGDPPAALLAYLRGLRLSGWTPEEKSDVLGCLVENSSPVIREVATATKAALAASGSGFALEWIAPDARATLGDLRPGDVVRSVEGEVPGSGDHLLEILSRVKIGESVILTVWREGQEFSLGWTGRAKFFAKFCGVAFRQGE